MDLTGRMHLTECSLTPPSVHPSTKDRRYQHAVYLVLYGKHGKTVLPWHWLQPCMGGGDVCCLLTAGDHPRMAIEKLNS